MRKPNKKAIMSVPVGPEVTSEPISGAGGSISDLANRLTGAAKGLDANSTPKEPPKQVAMPFIPEMPTQATQEPVVKQKGQMSLTGDLDTLNALKALAKAEKNTNAEMVAEMMEIYLQLKALGEPQRYSASEMLEVLKK